MKKIFLMLCLVLGITSGCGGSGSESEPLKPSQTPPPVVVNDDLAVATIKVKDYGEMQFQLYDDVKQTTDNFVSLANSGFYNGLTFHRLVKDFVIQGGDPSGNGTGGPGYSIKGEFDANGVTNNHTHKIGTLAMARSQDNDSAGSQFYIVTGEASSLDKQYAVFGDIISGQDVLTKLNNAPVGANDVPNPLIYIDSITIDTKGKTFDQPEKLAEK